MSGLVGFASTAAQDAINGLIGTIFSQIGAVESAATSITSAVLPPTNDTASGQAVMQDKMNTAQFSAMFKLGLMEIGKANMVVSANNHVQQAADAVGAAAAHSVDASNPAVQATASGTGSMSAAAPTLMNAATGMVSPLMSAGTQAVSAAARMAPTLAQSVAAMPAPTLPPMPDLGSTSGMPVMPGFAGVPAGPAPVTGSEANQVVSAVRTAVGEVIDGGDPADAVQEVAESVPTRFTDIPQVSDAFMVAAEQAPAMQDAVVDAVESVPQWPALDDAVTSTPWYQAADGQQMQQTAV